MTPAARLAGAVELLTEVDAAPRRPADAVANEFFRNRRYIGSGDRRAVSDRAWTVLRARRRLGWWLERAGAGQPPRLLIAASLLLEGWTLAAVSGAFSGGQFGAAPLVPVETAALATIEGHTLEHPEMQQDVRLELPAWLLAALQARFGDALEAEMAAMNLPASVDLRTNLLKGTREAAQAVLAAEGITAVPTPLSPWGLRIEGRRAITAGAAFQTGIVEIQDEGSQLVAALAGAGPQMRVADWCAGAGGKTLALAMTMQNRGHIVACDVHDKRLEGAVRRLRRAGVFNVEQHLIVAGDKWAKRRAGSFDRVLVDAPCTGTGTWRRNPDARLRTRPIDLEELISKQAMILDEACRLVRAGGWLVYSTCSLLLEENEAQVDGFLARHPEFAVVPLAQAWRLDAALPGPGPYLSLTPFAAWDRRLLRGGAGAHRVIALRRARPADAPSIAAIHVAAWRSAYAGILPEKYLARLSMIRNVARYDDQIRAGGGVYVAVSSGPGGAQPRLVGFTTVGRRGSELPSSSPADGEIETLYVLDDWREQGIGRRLLHAGAAHLAAEGSQAAFLWVLTDNPSRWFYERLGGKVVAHSRVGVGGVSVPQTAFAWNPIDRLLQIATAP